ncbi:hypothetical protein [Streptomyces sp. NBC_01803]|nr:hypothetical protein [Streptomyces sp. NBC_01803]WSA45069.1 hypothetical protein OIE51_13135 [Streptomyces sp. NBC_01803]
MASGGSARAAGWRMAETEEFTLSPLTELQGVLERWRAHRAVVGGGPTAT